MPLRELLNPYLIEDISELLLPASEMYSILFIIKSLSYVNRLNKISGVTSYMGVRWCKFTKIVNQSSMCVCLKFISNMKSVVRKGARIR